jgi:NAD(P)-dependent dehydrogenase (short-subunit alcohol dehydrogenase family)
MRIALVTGCGSGFGLLLARRLLASGWRVLATDEEVGGLEEAVLQGAPRTEALAVARMDVRDEGQVQRVCAEAMGWGPVGLLVNNAGIAAFGTQEEVPVEVFRDLLEVNVLGPARVTRALLPALRATRGAIVQLSSVAGRTVFPESGFYAATKHALEAMTEALHQETATFGIRVRLVEPGSFATGFLARAARCSPPPPEDSPYAELRPLWTQRKIEVLEPPQDPALVVDAIARSLEDPAPFRRVIVGPDAARILALRDQLGPHAWIRLAADRNGLLAPHEALEVPSPEELLGLPPGAPALQLARWAWQQGHLEHWQESEEGRAALLKLSALPPEPGEHPL